jgi:hypothetical protein
MTSDINNEERIINRVVKRVFGILILGGGLLIIAISLIWVIYFVMITMPELTYDVGINRLTVVMIWFIIYFIIGALLTGTGYTLYKSSKRQS